MRWWELGFCQSKSCPLRMFWQVFSHLPPKGIYWGQMVMVQGTHRAAHAVPFPKTNKVVVITDSKQAFQVKYWLKSHSEDILGNALGDTQLSSSIKCIPGIGDFSSIFGENLTITSKRHL